MVCFYRQITKIDFVIVIQLQDDKSVAKVMSMSDITISVVIPVFLTH